MSGEVARAKTLRESELLHQKALETFDPDAEVEVPEIHTPPFSFDLEKNEVTETEEAGELFSGKTFVILFDSEPNLLDCSDAITGNGGKILRIGSKDFDYAILPTLHEFKNEMSSRLFTEQWVVSLGLIIKYMRTCIIVSTFMVF
jgi:hypothetical protein